MLPLTLVGGIHGDERGFVRTLCFLHSFQPDLVLVELSPYGKAFRNRHQRMLQQTLSHHLRLAADTANLAFRKALTRPEIKAIRRQLALPFEYRAARRFSLATGSPLVLVDSSLFSRHMIQHWHELLSAENLLSLLVLPDSTRPAPARSYELAARIIRQEHSSPLSCGSPSIYRRDPLWQERERFMAARIRRAMQQLAPGKAVYLGGWQHLTVAGSSPSLRELLGLEHTPVVLLDRGYL